MKEIVRKFKLSHKRHGEEGNSSDELQFDETLDLDNFEVVKESPNHFPGDTFNISRSKLEDT